MLTGSAEVPGPGDPDASGTASITLNQGQGEVCFWEIRALCVLSAPLSKRILSDWLQSVDMLSSGLLDPYGFAARNPRIDKGLFYVINPDRAA